MKKGDIVLIPFPFTDLSGNKNRPALVLVVSNEDLTVCFISTKFTRKSEKDMLLTPTELNGLKKNSLLRLSKIATIDKELVLGKLGELNPTEISILNERLIIIFKLK